MQERKKSKRNKATKPIKTQVIKPHKDGLFATRSIESDSHSVSRNQGSKLTKIMSMHA